VIIFVATYEDAMWDPLRVAAAWVNKTTGVPAHDYTALRYIPIIAAFMQLEDLAEGYGTYVTVVHATIGEIIPFPASKIKPFLDSLRKARTILLPGEGLDFDKVYESDFMTTTAKDWERYEVMGKVSDSEAIAKKFIQMVDARDRPGTLLNSPIEFKIAREIQAYAIIPFFEQNRQV
jgi:hypothetical protein